MITARLLLLSLVLLSGCGARYAWVTRSGDPADPLHELRCDEYVMSQNGPRFTGFEAPDQNKCMRAHGYIKRWELEQQ